MPYKLPFNKVISKWTQPMCNKSQGHIIYYMALLKMVFFMQNFNIYHACKIAKESKIRTDKDVEMWFWNFYKSLIFALIQLPPYYTIMQLISISKVLFVWLFFRSKLVGFVCTNNTLHRFYWAFGTGRGVCTLGLHNVWVEYFS